MKLLEANNKFIFRHPTVKQPLRKFVPRAVPRAEKIRSACSSACTTFRVQCQMKLSGALRHSFSKTPSIQ